MCAGQRAEIEPALPPRVPFALPHHLSLLRLRQSLEPLFARALLDNAVKAAYSRDHSTPPVMVIVQRFIKSVKRTMHVDTTQAGTRPQLRMPNPALDHIAIGDIRRPVGLPIAVKLHRARHAERVCQSAAQVIADKPGNLARVVAQPHALDDTIYHGVN